MLLCNSLAHIFYPAQDEVVSDDILLSDISKCAVCFYRDNTQWKNRSTEWVINKFRSVRSARRPPVSESQPAAPSAQVHVEVPTRRLHHQFIWKRWRRTKEATAFTLLVLPTDLQSIKRTPWSRPGRICESEEKACAPPPPPTPPPTSGALLQRPVGGGHYWMPLKWNECLSACSEEHKGCWKRGFNSGENLLVMKSASCYGHILFANCCIFEYSILQNTWQKEK